MLLSVDWDGSAIPFEGDRPIPIRTIPEGAKVASARVTVTPIDPGAAVADLNGFNDSFVEHIVFSGAGPTWGANKVQGANFVEVDFRARRTLAAAQVVTAGGNLQIDPGGAYVEINDRGAIFSPQAGEARLLVATGLQILPAFQVARFKVTRLAAPIPNITEVLIRSVPENVSLRIGDEPVFHTFLGQMTSPEESIDFANLLNEFLGKAKVRNGFYDVSLMLHSDSIARLKINLALDVQQEHKPLANVKESVLTFTVDAIPIGAATQFKFDLPVGAEAVAGRTAVRFQGAFDDTRIAFGPLAPEVTGLHVDMMATPSLQSAQAQPLPAAQAQPFTLPDDLNITGIDLLLMPKTDVAEILVDIRSDLGGKPGAVSSLDAPLKITVRRNPKAQAQWLTTALPSELHLKKDVPRWLLVQQSTGDVTWSVQPTSSGPGLQQTTDNFLSWRAAAADAAPKLEAFFRLRNRPSRFTMPIHVFIGEGKDRQEVSLKDFEPKGNVDFVLDTEEFAATINKVAAQTAAHECQPVEHLLNGDLEQWLRSGSAPVVGAIIDHYPQSQAIVLSPDGGELYVAEFTRPMQVPGLNNLTAPMIKIVDPLCGRLIDAIPLSGFTQVFVEGNFQPRNLSLAVNATGQRLFLSFDTRLWMVDLAARSEIGTAIQLKLTASQGIRALAAGGGRLFLVPEPGTRVVAFEEADLAKAVAGGPEPVAIPNLTLPAIPNTTTTPTSAVAIAATADARTICVATAATTAISGTSASATAGSLIAIKSGIALPAQALSIRPTNITLSPDGKRAFLAAGNVGDALQVVDFEASAGPPPTVSLDLKTPRMISMASITGDRLAVLGADPNIDGNSSAIQVANFGIAVPKWWTITNGNIQPVSLLQDRFCIGGWLGKIDAPSPLSSISQVAPVIGGCLYDFSFWGAATSLGAAADVIWRRDQCTASRTDTIPITPNDQLQFCANTPLKLHRLRLRAPEGATQAEVRFRATDGVNAVIALISLKPPDGPVDNADFGQATAANVPQGWTLAPPNPPGFVFQNGEIRNGGLDPLVLLENVSVTAGRPFRLEYKGAVDATGAFPVAAVHWSGADPVLLELSPDGMGVRIAAGKIPEGVTTAEVSLTLPGGSALRPDYFLLRTGATTGVTFSVFAEAPGELTVSQFQIVSDVKPSTPPPVPPTGLCPPTKPGNDPDAPEECTYCPSCEGDQDMETSSQTTMIAGAPAVVKVAVCSNCGTALLQNTGAPVAGAQPTAVRLNLPTFAVLRCPTPAQRIQARERIKIFDENRLILLGGPLGAAQMAASSFHAVRGISREEVRNLDAAGIMTVVQLIALTPEELAPLLPTSSITRARLLLGLARKAQEAEPIVRADNFAPLGPGPTTGATPMPDSALRVVRGIGREEILSLEAAGIMTVDQLIALTPEELAALVPASSITRARLLLGLARKAREPKPE